MYRNQGNDLAMSDWELREPERGELEAAAPPEDARAKRPRRRRANYHTRVGVTICGCENVWMWVQVCVVEPTLICHTMDQVPSDFREFPKAVIN